MRRSRRWGRLRRTYSEGLALANDDVSPPVPGASNTPKETASTPTISEVESPMMPLSLISPSSMIPKALGCSTYTAQEPWPCLLPRGREVLSLCGAFVPTDAYPLCVIPYYRHPVGRNLLRNVDCVWLFGPLRSDPHGACDCLGSGCARHTSRHLRLAKRPIQRS